MRLVVFLIRLFSTGAVTSLAALLVTLHPQVLSAKTPDGVPPSQETVCSGLTGAAFGLCNAYCEAQDCDVHPRPSCAHLKRNFERITGSSVFPCDLFCGDQIVTPPEECDPPGSTCGDGGTCAADCTCKEPVCGDGVLDPGEECDPPGSLCMTERPCRADCMCAGPPSTCCQCGATAPLCFDTMNPDQCMAQNCTAIPGSCGDNGVCVP